MIYGRMQWVWKQAWKGSGAFIDSLCGIRKVIWPLSLRLSLPVKKERLFFTLKVYGDITQSSQHCFRHTANAQAMHTLPCLEIRPPESIHCTQQPSTNLVSASTDSGRDLFHSSIFTMWKYHWSLGAEHKGLRKLLAWLNISTQHKGLVSGRVCCLIPGHLLLVSRRFHE